MTEKNETTGTVELGKRQPQADGSGALASTWPSKSSSGSRPSPRTKGRFVKRESWGQTAYEDPYTGTRIDD